MNKDEVQHLFEYNRWANNRMFKALSELTTEKFTSKLPNSHRSVRDTLVHIISGEWIWLKRWKGMSPEDMFQPEDYPDLASVQQKWGAVESEQTDFVNKITDDLLDMNISYVNTEGETCEYQLVRMMQHVVNHSTYHRGQVMALLKQLGEKPVATDLLVFHDVKNKKN